MASQPSSTSNLAPEFALLGLIAEQPAHGYELHQRLQTELGQGWHLSQSQVYNILKRLEKDGYLVGQKVEQENYPNRTYYKLTRVGQEHFETWLGQTTGCSTRAVRIEFITRLYFTRRRNKAQAAQLLGRQIKVVADCVRHLEEERQQIPEQQYYNRSSADLRLRQLNSLADWLQELAAEFHKETP